MTIEKRIEKIVKCVEAGISSFVGASEEVVYIIDNGNYTIKMLSDKTGLGKATLRELERIGRGHQVANLFIYTYPASRHIKKLPYDKQVKVLEEGIKTLSEDGKYETKEAQDLTIEDTRVVFDNGRLRNKKEQKAKIEEIREAKDNQIITVIPHKPVEEYTISKDKTIKFNLSDKEYTVQDLLTIIGKLT